jgi:fatty acid desaturase
MPTGRFFLIMLFGFIISLAELVYEELKFKFIVRGLIHYAILLCFFFIVFVLSGNLVIKGAATVFAAVIIFTLLYFAVYAIVHFSGKVISELDRKLDKKSNADKAKKQTNKKTYTPRFKD